MSAEHPLDPLDADRVETEPGPDSGSPAPATPWPSADRTVPITLTIVGVLIAFFLVRVLGAPWPKFPPSYPDSFSYLKVATLGPFHPEFYFTERPIGYPLLLWLMGRSSTLIVVAQTLIYVAAWATLAWVVVVEMKSKTVAVVAVVFLAALAIEPRNSLWNTVILSESFSTSLALFATAAWWRAAARPSKRSITWAWIATGAWILVRDTNVLPTVLVILPAVVLLLWRGPVRDKVLRKRLMTGSVAILVVCGYVYVSQAASHRTQYSVHNFIGMRVLPDKELTDWFVARGMPMSPALQARTGHNAWDDNEAFLTSPDLAKYREWARGPGARWQLISMGVLAPAWWTRLHRELPNILRSNDLEYDTYHVGDRLPKHFPGPLGTPRGPGVLWAYLLLTIAGLAMAWSDRRRRLLAYMVTIALLSAMVDIWTSYIGDPMEVNRHMVGPLARLCVAMILAIALGTDALIERIKERRAASPAPTAAEPPDGAPSETLEEAAIDA